MRNSLVVVRIDNIYIYNIYTAECIELSSVGLAPARPNYRRTSDRSNYAWRRTARILTAHAHRCVKLKKGQSILNKVRKGMQAKSKR